jgi:hypothetical protein
MQSAWSRIRAQEQGSARQALSWPALVTMLLACFAMCLLLESGESKDSQANVMLACSTQGLVQEAQVLVASQT